MKKKFKITMMTIIDNTTKVTEKIKIIKTSEKKANIVNIMIMNNTIKEKTQISIKLKKR